MLGLWFTAIMPGIDRWSKRFFLSYFFVLILCWTGGGIAESGIILPLIVIMLLNLAGVIRFRKRISHKIFLSFLASIVPTTAVFFVQLFFEVFPLIDIGYVISALSMYSLILSAQITNDLNYQREIANQRANIMVLQMRPHFIYNTMTSIYCLCNQNPKLARQVIMDFTTYLRKNFTAIASAEPIHVCIRTRKTDSGSEIIVADNGRCFTLNDDGEAHIALKNIQQAIRQKTG